MSNLSFVAKNIEVPSTMMILSQTFSVAIYLAGLYFAIIATRRHIKETLSSGGKARIEFFWQHIVSILLVAMPYLISRISIGATDLMDVDSLKQDRAVLVLIAVIILLTQVVAFVVGFVISRWNEWKREKCTKDESGDVKS